MTAPHLAADGDDQNAVRRLNDMFAADADRFYRRADDLENAGRSAAAGIARRQADIYAAAVRETTGRRKPGADDRPGRTADATERTNPITSGIR